MATVTLIPVRRAGLYFYRHHQMLECQGCLEQIPVARRLIADPEEFAIYRECHEHDHAACARYSNVFEAQRARREKRQRASVLPIR